MNAKEYMKKLLSKIRFKRKEIKDMDAPERITTNTVAEHREKVLSEGRRFKYPFQYSKNRLVINAIVISVVALAATIGIGYWQLYTMQNSSEFMYRVTKVFALPVAYIDGEVVLYSDYLMKYRSSVHYLEQKEQVDFGGGDGKRQLDYLKEQSMQDAVADSYARKLAREMGISVSDEEVEDFIETQRVSSNGEVSEAAYESVIREFYDWSPSEYRHIMSSKLLRQKVAFRLDDKARDVANKAGLKLSTDSKVSMKEYAETLNKDTGEDIVYYGNSGLVSVDNQDGGLAKAASNLAIGQVSGMIQSASNDGYYYVKLLDKNESSVSYEYINIKLTEFESQLQEKINTDAEERFITISVEE